MSRYVAFPIEVYLQWTAPADHFVQMDERAGAGLTAELIRDDLISGEETIWTWGLSPEVRIAGRTISEGDGNEVVSKLGKGDLEGRLFRLTISGTGEVTGDQLWHHSSKLAREATLDDVAERLDPDSEKSVEYDHSAPIKSVWEVLSRTGVLNLKSLDVEVEEVKLEITPA